MNAAPFETIPAWRIARLRTVLRDAEQRGANPDDEGHDLSHRALRGRFALARDRAKTVPRPASKPKTTRKGRSFPHLKLVIIWRAILSCRSSAWRRGDKVPFGSIRRAHDQAVAACRAAGLAPPRYRTVYVLWHRGVPPADVAAALRGEYENPPG
jgi:Ni/Co efflux regulator RcnB